MMDNNTYPKKEKLKQKNELNSVFQNGKWKTYKDLRVVFLKKENDLANAKFGVSVSKKFFKKAVDRNRIKRLLRECYRLNKTTYYDAFGKDTHAMLFWVSKDLPQRYGEVEIQFLNLCKKMKNTPVVHL